MTEAEWLSCTDPLPMLDFLKGKASDRKLRLFAVAAFNCRGFDNRNDSNDDVVQGARHAAMVAELYADGNVTDQALEEARTGLLFQVLLRPQAWSAAKQSCRSTINLSCRQGRNSVDAMERQLCSLLHCTFGNPFHPITLDPSWLNPTLKTLAQKIYDDRTFDQFPILADSLLKLGCAVPEILDHLRGPGPHVRGCWSVDLVLGRG